MLKGWVAQSHSAHANTRRRGTGASDRAPVSIAAVDRGGRDDDGASAAADASDSGELMSLTVWPFGERRVPPQRATSAWRLARLLEPARAWVAASSLRRFAA
ncbi:hypothetical protein GCM10025774_25270 [Microbacterium kyungheense]